MRTLYDKLSNVNFQNDLSFSLCATLSVSYVVATSEDGTKSKRDEY